MLAWVCLQPWFLQKWTTKLTFILGLFSAKMEMVLFFKCIYFRINLQLAVKETSVFLLFATRVYKRDFKYFHCNNHSPLKFLNNSLNPDISMYILRTILFKFPEVLTRRICPIIKGFFSWWSFPQFVLVTLMFDPRVKFDAS